MKKYKIAYVIAKFQVPDLHHSQIKFLSDLTVKYNEVRILLDTPIAKGTIESPLDFDARYYMIKKYFPDINIVPLDDKKSDSGWSNLIDSFIKSHGSLNNSYIYLDVELYPRYKGLIAKKEFETSIIEADARSYVKNHLDSNLDFRNGIIYASQHQWPKVYPTVDIGVIRVAKAKCKENPKLQIEVLLGKKKGSDQLRFPGGFADPTDLFFEHTAGRELEEETNLRLDLGSFKYVCSLAIDDWRYKGRDKIITTFFMAEISPEHSLLAKAGDDLAEVGWYPLKEVEVMEDHGILLENLKHKILEGENA